MGGFESRERAARITIDFESALDPFTSSDQIVVDSSAVAIEVLAGSDATTLDDYLGSGELINWSSPSKALELSVTIALEELLGTATFSGWPEYLSLSDVSVVRAPTAGTPVTYSFTPDSFVADWASMAR